LIRASGKVHAKIVQNDPAALFDLSQLGLKRMAAVQIQKLERRYERFAIGGYRT
jgi:hypothetical protein